MLIDPAQLTHVLHLNGEDVAVVRPGLSLSILFDDPLPEIGADVVKMLMAYLEMVPKGAINTYLANDGYWKPISKRAFTAKMQSIKNALPGEYWDFYYGQAPEGGIGEHGAYFNGVPNDPACTPDQCSMLILEFPFFQAGQDDADLAEVRKFADWVFSLRSFSCGYLGYAFKHPQMTFRDEAYEFITAKAARYLGFDISDISVAFDSVGKLVNISWITFLGAKLLEKAGGAPVLAENIGDAAIVKAMLQGVAIVAAGTPPVCDVNRLAEDCGGLSAVYRATAAIRQEQAALSLDQDDGLWQRRFERLLA